MEKNEDNMDQIKGSMETLSAMQITADMEGLDAQSKSVLHSREVLAVILQGTVSEEGLQAGISYRKERALLSGETAVVTTVAGHG